MITKLTDGAFWTLFAAISSTGKMQRMTAEERLKQIPKLWQQLYRRAVAKKSREAAVRSCTPKRTRAAQKGLKMAKRLEYRKGVLDAICGYFIRRKDKHRADRTDRPGICQSSAGGLFKPLKQKKGIVGRVEPVKRSTGQSGAFLPSEFSSVKGDK